MGALIAVLGVVAFEILFVVLMFVGAPTASGGPSANMPRVERSDRLRCQAVADPTLLVRERDERSQEFRHIQENLQRVVAFR